MQDYCELHKKSGLNSKTSIKLLYYTGDSDLITLIRNISPGTLATIYVNSSHTSNVTGLPVEFSRKGCYILSFRSTATGYGLNIAYCTNGNLVAVCSDNPESYEWVLK